VNLRTGFIIVALAMLFGMHSSQFLGRYRQDRAQEDIMAGCLLAVVTYYPSTMPCRMQLAIMWSPSSAEKRSYRRPDLTL